MTVIKVVTFKVVDAATGADLDVGFMTEGAAEARAKKLMRKHKGLAAIVERVAP
jgi:hypothetical protein